MVETSTMAGGQSRSQLIAAFNAKLLREQNLPLGIAAGAATALAGALVWMGITVATEMHIGYVALAVGAGVGYANRYLGKGVTKIFGVVGAIFTFLGCLAGEVLADIQMVASAHSIGFFDAASQVDPVAVATAILEHSTPISYFIYAIGIYEGYKFSFRRVTAQELQEAGLNTPPPPPPA